MGLKAEVTLEAMSGDGIESGDRVGQTEEQDSKEKFGNFRIVDH